MATATTQRQIRLSAFTKQAMGEVKDKDKGLGKVITEAMKPYVDGGKELPHIEDRAIIRVNVPLDSVVAEEFEKLAKANGYTFDQAVRLILTEAFDNKRNTPTESDNNHALDRNESQNPA